tara:strand:- start:51 stop:563 length:513 start_codon:yes stop_codon:yes gene_type:complete
MFCPQLKALIALSDADAASEASRVLERRGISNLLSVKCTYDAIDAMVKGSFGLFVVDAPIPMTLSRPGVPGGIDFIRFIRMCEGEMGEAVVVFLRSKLGEVNLLQVRDEIVTVRDSGANCILNHPLTFAKFDEYVAPDLVKPRLFLRMAGYTGPCRRRVKIPVENERRKS